jgi:hypothetical protein
MSDRLRNRYTKTYREIAQDFLILPAQYSPDVEADQTFRARSPTGPLLVGLAIRERTGGQRVPYSRRLNAWRKIAVQAPSQVPARFELAIFQNDEKRRVCEVAWRRGKVLGVKFVS